MTIAPLRTAFRVLLAALVALPFAMLAATDADAKKRSKARKPAPPPARVYDDNSRWYPNNADKLKFGSRIWWDQMQKEGRIGGGGGDFRR